MAYREREETLKVQVADLEQQLAELDKSDRLLRGKLERAERALEAYRPGTREGAPTALRRSMLYTFGVGLLFSVNGFGFLLGDAPVGVLFALIAMPFFAYGPTLVWLRAGKPGLGLATSVVKVTGAAFLFVLWGAQLPQSLRWQYLMVAMGLLAAMTLVELWLFHQETLAEQER